MDKIYKTNEVEPMISSSERTKKVKVYPGDTVWVKFVIKEIDADGYIRTNIPNGLVNGYLFKADSYKDIEVKIIHKDEII